MAQDLGNVKGPQGNTGATGPQGPTGAQGPSGSAATVAVGTTTTGAAGTNANVQNSGTQSAAVLNFTIPKGADGRDFGDFYQNTAGKSVANNSNTTITSISNLPTGHYILMGFANFQSTSGTGTRRLWITGPSSYSSKEIEIDGNANGYTQIMCGDIVNTGGTYNLVCAQSSGSAVTVSGTLKAMRIS